MRAGVGQSGVPATPLYKLISEHIRALIRAGELKPGDQLPTQNELAAQFECSIQPVKWALRELEIEGLIATQQGLGSFVAQHPESSE